MSHKNIDIKRIESKHCAVAPEWDGEEYKVRVPVYGITAFGILFAPEYRSALIALCKKNDILTYTDSRKTNRLKALCTPYSVNIRTSRRLSTATRIWRHYTSRQCIRFSDPLSV